MFGGNTAELFLSGNTAAHAHGFDAVDCGDIYSGVEELIGLSAAKLRVHTK